MKKEYSMPEMSVSNVRLEDVVLASSALKTSGTQKTIDKTFKLVDF